MGFGSFLSKGYDVLTGKAGADEASHAAGAARDRIGASKTEALGRLDPYSNFGKQAMTPLSALLYGQSYDPKTGAFSAISDEERMSQFQQSPGYEFRLNEGLKAVERRNAATGTLLGGNTQKELMNYGQNTASDEYGNYLNQLMGMLGVGQNADTNAANIISGAGQQMASYDYAGGMAKANQYNNLTNLLYSVAGSAVGGSGSTGGGASSGSGSGGGTYNGSFFSQSGSQQMSPYTMLSMAGSGGGGAAAAASDINLKENIVKIAEEKGFNIYEFNYIGHPNRYRGVMAQEIQKIAPEAVFEKDGFLAVDYNKIGVEFKKI